MNHVQIDDLSPGEAVLSSDKLAKYRQLLERGESLDPVHFYEADGKLVVRDGNNRVRAYIEHCRTIGLLVETISCIASTAPAPGPAALDGLRRVSWFCGKGVEAFMLMPVAEKDEYENTQTEVGQRIWEKWQANQGT